MSAREAAVAGTVALVLADSSIVTLGLPDILREFDTTVELAAWVLIVFNLVLAATLVPFAVVSARVGPRALWAGGVVALAVTSAACALAPSIEVLLVARALQAAGGAALLAGAVALLAVRRGSEEAGARVWAPASVAGLAIGPVAGGLLTEWLSWQAIFAVQVPVALLAVLAPRVPAVPAAGSSRPPLPRAPALALALMSAALTAALFLLVILLTRGWEYSAAEAAGVVTVMALATVAGGAIGRGFPHAPATAAAGTVAVAGGLAALGLLPDAGWGWTLAPQALIGLGLGLALPVLTDHALPSGGRPGAPAVGTLWVRHAGVVVGLFVLVPLFSADLEDQQEAAERAGTALLLEARLPPATKIELADAIAQQIERADGRLPRLAPAFRTVGAPEDAAADFTDLRRSMTEELDRAATQAFSRSFLVAALLALLTLVPVAITARRRR